MTTEKKTAKAADPFESMTNFNPESFKEGYEKLAEGVSAAADFQKGSFDAVVASAGAVAKGVEKLTSEQAAFVKSSFENGVETAKAAAASGSVQEALEINSDFLRSSFEKNLNQFNKVSELWVETSKEALAPLSERYGELVEKIQAYRP